MDSANDAPLKTSLDDNINLFKTTFAGDNTLVIRYAENQNDSKLKFCFIYFDGMVDNKLLNDSAIRPVEQHFFTPSAESILDITAKSVVFSNGVSKTDDFNKILDELFYGNTIILADGESAALIVETKGWKTRQSKEPEAEKTLRGPREGFVESIMRNISMVRRRLRNPDLKFIFRTFGARTNTKACVCYLDSLVNKNVLNELNKRLDQFSIDGVLDVNYISEFISDSRFSPVKTVGSTEKPDVVAAKLLEGRVAVFLDGTPMVLTCPHLLIENFQSDEDYYVNYFFASIGRFLRVFSFFISICTPSVYVALTTFHQEFIPRKLIISICAAREGVPFPTVLETAMLLVIFEILREAGTRMPQAIGPTLSIVGVLVIGQAAVVAKFVSAPVIIVVAVTGLTSIMTPRIKGTDIMLRFIFLAASSIIGLYGLMFCMLGFLIHIYSLTSFGIPIVSGLDSLKAQSNKDILIRAPWWFMKKRPEGLSSDPVRQPVKK